MHVESTGKLNSEYYNIPLIINDKKLSGRFACKSFSINYVNKD